VPQRIPIHMRKDVNKIIKDMRDQDVIEKSKNPLMSQLYWLKKE